MAVWYGKLVVEKLRYLKFSLLCRQKVNRDYAKIEEYSIWKIRKKYGREGTEGGTEKVKGRKE